MAVSDINGSMIHSLGMIKKWTIMVKRYRQSIFNNFKSFIEIQMYHSHTRRQLDSSQHKHLAQKVFLIKKFSIGHLSLKYEIPILFTYQAEQRPLFMIKYKATADPKFKSVIRFIHMSWYQKCMVAVTPPTCFNMHT